MLNHHFNILIGTLTDRLTEHMGESCRFVHFFCVETEHRLVNVPFKVCLADEVIGSEDNPLEMSPKALNAVG